MTAFRCKHIKPDGSRVDGCGWQGQPTRWELAEACGMPDKVCGADG